MLAGLVSVLGPSETQIGRILKAAPGESAGQSQWHG